MDTIKSRKTSIGIAAAFWRRYRYGCGRATRLDWSCGSATGGGKDAAIKPGANTSFGPLKQSMPAC